MRLSPFAPRRRARAVEVESVRPRATSERPCRAGSRPRACRRDRTPAARPAPGDPRRADRAARPRRRARRARAQLVGLLEVVPEDLLEFGRSAGLWPRLLEPVGEALVQVGAGALEQAVVHDVAHQQAAEPVVDEQRRVRATGTTSCGATRAAGPASVSTGGLQESRPRRRSRTRGRSRTPARGCRARPPQGRRCGQRARPRPSAGTLTCSRSAVTIHASIAADQHAVVDQHRQELLDEQRVAGSRPLHAIDQLAPAGPHGPAQPPPPRPPPRSSSGSSSMHVWVDRRRGTTGFAAVGLGRPFHRDQEDRGVTQVVARSSSSSSSVGSAQCRPSTTTTIGRARARWPSSTPDRPEQLGDGIRGVGQAGERREPLDHALASGTTSAIAARAASASSPDADAGRLLDELHDRPEGDALAVGQAASAQHLRARSARARSRTRRPGGSCPCRRRPRTSIRRRPGPGRWRRTPRRSWRVSASRPDQRELAGVQPRTRCGRDASTR